MTYASGDIWCGGYKSNDPSVDRRAMGDVDTAIAWSIAWIVVVVH
jgi:hypothetical protein